MYRATTPIHSFHFEENPQNYERLLITYAQDKMIIMEKTKEDLTFETEIDSEGNIDYIASFQLTQEEANRFTSVRSSIIQVQVRALDSSDNAYASDMATFSVKDVLDDRILVAGT